MNLVDGVDHLLLLNLQHAQNLLYLLYLLQTLQLMQPQKLPQEFYKLPLLIQPQKLLSSLKHHQLPYRSNQTQELQLPFLLLILQLLLKLYILKLKLC
jgi:hypothetical protein